MSFVNRRRTRTYFDEASGVDVTAYPGFVRKPPAIFGEDGLLQEGPSKYFSRSTLVHRLYQGRKPTFSLELTPAQIHDDMASITEAFTASEDSPSHLRAEHPISSASEPRALASKSSEDTIGKEARLKQRNINEKKRAREDAHPVDVREALKDTNLQRNFFL
jgi:hypothetical protein